MVEEMQQQQKIDEQKTSQSSGCLWNGLFIFSIIWILLISGIVQAAEWVVEQLLFEGSLGIVDMRWAIQFAFPALLIIPAILMRINFNSKNVRQVGRAVLWAVLFSLFMAFTSLVTITNAQGVAVIQIAGMLLFLLFYYLLDYRRHQHSTRQKTNQSVSLGIAASGAGLIGIPWMLWGALGSFLDTLLGLVTALLFAVCVNALYEKATRFREGVSGEREFGFPKRIGVLFFLMSVMIAGLGRNGNQWLVTPLAMVLVFILPLLDEIGKKGGVENSPQSIGKIALLGLSLAFPLIMFDADELNIVVGSGNGEVLGWAIRTVTTSTIIAGLFLIFLFVVRKRFNQLDHWTLAGKILPAGVWVLMLTIYFSLGQPGLFGEKYFVVFKDQADLSAIEKITDQNDRREFVYQTLSAHAQTTQANLAELLARRHVDFQSYYLVNGMEVSGGPLIRLWLQSRPEVDRVLDNPMLRPLNQDIPAAEGISAAPTDIEWNLTSIEADKVWKMGITGKGIVVGQSDSGVQGDHVELADGYRGKTDGNDYNWFDPWNQSQSPVDIGGHGTHTLGSILGNRVGVAPDAEWIGCVNLARNLGNPAYYLDCMQFMLAPFPQDGDPMTDGDPAKGAQILNNSWGCPEIEGCDPAIYESAVEALHDAGIFVVVSAGNSGYSGCGSVDAPPAIYADVFTVGAFNSNGELSAFSSLGPVLVDGSNRTKPDIIAPGENVLSAFPGNTYEIASGTSMAGPHVVGVVALMWSANPQLIGEVELTRQILVETADEFKGVIPECVLDNSSPNNAVGYGRVNAYRAVQRALEFQK